VPRFGHELDVIRQAHRVRGAHGGRGPFAAVARWWGYIVPLLAGAIRHAERVALAMDAAPSARTPTAPSATSCLARATPCSSSSSGS
jgi:energy-coupling factor transporter transmembrane protein EcfT